MLTQKPHTWLEIDPNAFSHNIRLYKELSAPNTIISVVLKSNAYGHGIEQMAKLCQENADVQWLCTASLSEALIIRNLGITKPIIVLSIIDEDPALAIIHDIDLPIFDLDTAIILNQIGVALNKKIAVHVKIDSGMSRFGLHTNEALHVIQEIHKLPGIMIRALFTHCAESGNPNPSFTLEQLEQFNSVIKQCDDAGIQISYKHAANSAAASLSSILSAIALASAEALASEGTMQSLFTFNFIRLGAGAYGLWHFRDAPSNHANLDLKPVLSWKTRISHLKKVPANSCIGYDRTFQTTRETIIATIPVGYHDGYDRRFTNQGIIRIRDYYAHVVGRICMNATLIAIPEGHEVALGDEVILLGDYDQLRAHDLATLIGSFNAREITTRLSPHLIRKIMPVDAVHEKTCKNAEKIVSL